MKYIAVSIVRNCEDIIACVSLNYLMLEFDRVIVLDNGSSDRTLRKLEQLSFRFPSLVVLSDGGKFDQPAFFEHIVNGYVRTEGETIVVPFDCDELWDLDKKKILREFEFHEANILHGRVLNYVQHRSIEKVSGFGDFYITQRALFRSRNSEKDLQEGRISLIELPPRRKVIFRTDRQVKFHPGQHKVDFEGMRPKRTDRIRCYHIPVRSKSELEKRAAVAERHLDPADAGQSWHFRWIAGKLAEGRLEAEWRANSTRFGLLDVNGRMKPTLFDPRLALRIHKIARFAKTRGIEL